MAVDNISARLIGSLNKNTKQLEGLFEKISSGKRINRASDDAAGLAIVDALESDVKTLDQASRNASDGISQIAIADGATSSISDINTRLQELASQASNGTLSGTQRGSLNSEFQQLTQERDRIISSTEFNGVKVFNGSSTNIQVGNGSDSNSQVSIPSLT